MIADRTIRCPGVPASCTEMVGGMRLLRHGHECQRRERDEDKDRASPEVPPHLDEHSEERAAGEDHREQREHRERRRDACGLVEDESGRASQHERRVARDRAHDRLRLRLSTSARRARCRPRATRSSRRSSWNRPRERMSGRRALRETTTGLDWVTTRGRAQRCRIGRRPRRSRPAPDRASAARLRPGRALRARKRARCTPTPPAAAATFSVVLASRTSPRAVRCLYRKLLRTPVIFKTVCARSHGLDARRPIARPAGVHPLLHTAVCLAD